MRQPSPGMFEGISFVKNLSMISAVSKKRRRNKAFANAKAPTGAREVVIKGSRGFFTDSLFSLPFFA
jgi:hypothetical protein